MKAPCVLGASNGMTLVELLMVLGVLVVLITLIFPTINSVIESSHSAKCVYNLRNYGAAAMNFTAEQPDGVVLPYLFWEYNPATEKNTHSTKRGKSTWYENLVLHGVGNASAQHTCLSAEVRYKPKANGALGHADNLSNYGWSTSIPYIEGELLRIVSVANASKLFLCADSSATKKMQDSKTGSSWNIANVNDIQYLEDPDRRQNFGFRHKGKANILFADGHVEARRPSEIPLRTSPRTKEWLLFWEGREN